MMRHQAQPLQKMMVSYIRLDGGPDMVCSSVCRRAYLLLSRPSSRFRCRRSNHGAFIFGRNPLDPNPRFEQVEIGATGGLRQERKPSRIALSLDAIDRKQTRQTLLPPTISTMLVDCQKDSA